MRNEKEVCFSRFNPTMVRLGQAEKGGDHDHNHGFNPTMVRLGHLALLQDDLEIRGFNPTMVRLGPRLRLGQGSLRDCVSIPLWCD